MCLGVYLSAVCVDAFSVLSSLFYVYINVMTIIMMKFSCVFHHADYYCLVYNLDHWCSKKRCVGRLFLLVNVLFLPLLALRSVLF